MASYDNVVGKMLSLKDKNLFLISVKKYILILSKKVSGKSNKKERRRKITLAQHFTLFNFGRMFSLRIHQLRWKLVLEP
jgi:hypothetical protein